MSVYPYLAGIATLLIGIQVFTPKLVEAQVQPNLPNTISTKQLSIASNKIDLREVTKFTQSFLDYEPPDNGGPDNTQGSGTR